MVFQHQENAAKQIQYANDRGDCFPVNVSWIQQEKDYDRNPTIWDCSKDILEDPPIFVVGIRNEVIGVYNKTIIPIATESICRIKTCKCHSFIILVKSSIIGITDFEYIYSLAY